VTNQVSFLLFSPPVLELSFTFILPSSFYENLLTSCNQGLLFRSKFPEISVLSVGPIKLAICQIFQAFPCSHSDGPNSTAQRSNSAYSSSQPTKTLEIQFISQSFPSHWLQPHSWRRRRHSHEPPPPTSLASFPDRTQAGLWRASWGVSPLPVPRPSVEMLPCSPSLVCTSPFHIGGAQRMSPYSSTASLSAHTAGRIFSGSSATYGCMASRLQQFSTPVFGMFSLFYLRKLSCQQ